MSSRYERAAHVPWIHFLNVQVHGTLGVHLRSDDGLLYMKHLLDILGSYLPKVRAVRWFSLLAHLKKPKLRLSLTVLHKHPISTQERFKEEAFIECKNEGTIKNVPAVVDSPPRPSCFMTCV